MRHPHSWPMRAGRRTVKPIWCGGGQAVGRRKKTRHPPRDPILHIFWMLRRSREITASSGQGCGGEASCRGGFSGVLSPLCRLVSPPEGGKQKLLPPLSTPPYLWLRAPGTDTPSVLCQEPACRHWCLVLSVSQTSNKSLPPSPQEMVYQATTKSLIEGVISGYNATVFAYGPTGEREAQT